MSNIKNTSIQGDVSISRNNTIGRDLKVNGNSEFGHNVIIKGWLDANNIKGACKGLYASLDKLKEEYPKPRPGWYALIGDTLPADVYREENGQWVATGEKGGEINPYLDELENNVKDYLDTVEDIYNTINEYSWLYDGGRADTNYGGARNIDCGRADS